MPHMHCSITVAALFGLASTSQAKNPFPPIPANVCLSIDDFDRAAGAPPVVISFDDLPCNTALEGQSLCGVAFQMINAPLEVVCADDTFTPHGFQSAEHPGQSLLRATSGSMLLSPGGTTLAPGPNPSVEDDDIIMIFNPPVACIGFDHLSQYADGKSYTQVQVIADDASVLYQGTIEIGSGRWLIEHGEQRLIGSIDSPPQDGPEHTVDFWGFVSTMCNIREVRIDETDDNDVCPDSNIGIDSIRFAPFPTTCGSGDITGDGSVDSADIERLVHQFGSADPKKGQRVEWSAADFNRDGTIDSADLLALLDHTH
jgi:hypothetical protein